MSVRAVAWVLHESPSTGNDRLVLIAIADEADDQGLNAFPGIRLIAHKARVDRRTTMRALARLEAAGELLVRRPDHPGRGRFNRYVVVMGRDPVALAGQLHWPPPNLDPAGAEIGECQNDTHGIRPPQGGDNPGDNSAGRARKGVTGDSFGIRSTPTGAPDPLTLTDTGRARRRGLDPQPEERQVAASLKMAAAGTQAVKRIVALPPPAPATVTAGITAARASLARNRADSARFELGDGSTIRTPNEDDDEQPQ